MHLQQRKKPLKGGYAEASNGGEGTTLQKERHSTKKRGYWRGYLLPSLMPCFLV